MSSQVFAVHPRNHRCFVYRGRPFKVLTSAEHYGAVLNADFDYDVYLEEMGRTGQNATRVFTFYRETAESIPGPGPMNTLAPTPEGSVMPWERVAGRGEAADGLDKFDLGRWNAAYFERLKAFVGKCGDRGVVCEIVLFCNPYDQGRYDLFPCSRASNVNGVGEDLDAPQKFMTLDAPSITAFQERFVRKMAEELNPFDNVYYEICNEPNFSGDFSEATEQKVVAWHARISRVLREAEARLPNRHLIAVNAHFVVRVSDDPERPVVRHEDLSYFENPDIDIVNYHYLSAHAENEGLRFVRLPNREAQAGLIWRFLRERDRFEKPVVFDETFSGIVRGAPERLAVNRAEAWEMLLSGGAGYSNLDWSFTQADETGAGRVPIGDGRRLDWRPLRGWYRIFRRLLEQYDLAALVPAVGLVCGEVPGCGYAATTDGEGRYILYLVDEKVYQLEACESRRVTLSLALPAGRYSARAFDPRTGEAREMPGLQGGGVARLETPAFSEDVAMLLDAVS